MKAKKIPSMKTNVTGQALTEFMIMAPVFIAVMLAIAWHASIIITKLQLISAARYGTDLIRHLNLNDNQVKRELNDFLVDKAVRKLDSRRLEIKVEVHGNDMSGIFHPACSVVEIFYTFNLPVWMGGKMKISGRSEVLNGTNLIMYDHS